MTVRAAVSREILTKCHVIRQIAAHLLWDHNLETRYTSPPKKLVLRLCNTVKHGGCCGCHYFEYISTPVPILIVLSSDPAYSCMLSVFWTITFAVRCLKWHAHHHVQNWSALKPFWENSVVKKDRIKLDNPLLQHCVWTRSCRNMVNRLKKCIQPLSWSVSRTDLVWSWRLSYPSLSKARNLSSPKCFPLHTVGHFSAPWEWEWLLDNPQHQHNFKWEFWVPSS